MDFAALKSRIQSIIGRAPNDVCYELVTADINQDMRLRSMESTTTLTAALSMALPSDFLSAASVYVNTDPRRTLRQTEPQAFNRGYSDGVGEPSLYAIVDGAMLLDSVNTASDIELRYVAKLADLSADSDTNDVLTNHPSVYIYGALAHHAALIRDTEAAATWAAAYRAEMNSAKASDRKKGGPPLSVIPRSVA